ncbi:MAG: YkgJ family cysteine cluster protein [Geobacteraceae bacterium]|nr:YkgJ family cysteine cluster protein [Geobacteraceae bacterium]
MSARIALLIFIGLCYLSDMSRLLENYRQLVARIDALCSAIEASLADQITCSEGCSSCCTAITLFPVEAAALRSALEELPEAEAEEIRQQIVQHNGSERCPLLSHHRCLLYRARPIICRTHGLPIIYTEDNLRKSDCCPLNLSEAGSVSGSSVIDLDKLNTLLVAVNSLYLSQSETEETGERLTIAEALTKR